MVAPSANKLRCKLHIACSYIEEFGSKRLRAEPARICVYMRTYINIHGLRCVDEAEDFFGLRGICYGIVL